MGDAAEVRRRRRLLPSCRCPAAGGLGQAQVVINGLGDGSVIAPETLQRLVEVLAGQSPMAADLAGGNLPGASLIRPQTLVAADVLREFVQECHGGFLKHLSLPRNLAVICWKPMCRGGRSQIVSMACCISDLG
jgi:hypothetical protein